MSTGSAVQAKRVFVVLNPVAGTSVVEDVRQALDHHFLPGETSCEVHETVKGDAIERIAHEAQGRGYEMVVAAGGDGTVSAVAEGLVGTETPLGIIPLGTANVLRVSWASRSSWRVPSSCWPASMASRASTP